MSGSECYSANEYTPMEAINDKTGMANKFGGPKTEG